MTAHPSPYARLRRALAAHNALLAWAAAAELKHVPLPEALGLCLLLVGEPERFDRAIVRWHARFCLEGRGVGPDEAGLALAALRSLPGSGARAGASALAGLCEAHGLVEAAEVVEEWLSLDPPILASSQRQDAVATRHRPRFRWFTT